MFHTYTIYRVSIPESKNDTDFIPVNPLDIEKSVIDIWSFFDVDWYGIGISASLNDFDGAPAACSEDLEM